MTIQDRREKKDYSVMETKERIYFKKRTFSSIFAEHLHPGYLICIILSVAVIVLLCCVAWKTVLVSMHVHSLLCFPGIFFQILLPFSSSLDNILYHYNHPLANFFNFTAFLSFCITFLRDLQSWINSTALLLCC